MAFEGAGEEADLLPFHVGGVALLGKPVLLTDHRISGQHLDGLEPGPVHGFVFG